MEQQRQAALSERERRSRFFARFTIGWVLFLALALGYIGFDWIHGLGAETDEARERARLAEQERNQARGALSNLRRARARELDLVARSAGGRGAALLAAGVDWERTRAAILGLDAGARQDAAVTALLLAWGAAPPAPGGAVPEALDPLRLLAEALAAAGVTGETLPGESPAAALARAFSRFERTDAPRPGDLAVFGSGGREVALMFLGPGARGGHGVCVGAVEPGARAMLLDSAALDAAAHPFVAYRRVPY